MILIVTSAPRRRIIAMSLAKIPYPLKPKNLMKRYISVKVVPHYKKIFLYYSGKYNDEKLTLECCNRNRDKLFSSKEIVNWKNPLNTF